MPIPNSGHVFVIRGDLKNLACSAWMQTTDRRLRPGGRWEVEITDAPQRITATDRAAFEAEQVFAIPVWPRGDAPEPIPFLTAVPFHGVKTADDFRPRIRAFVEVAVPIARARPTGDRPRPLLAMPPIGFGRGGGNLRKGDVIRMILDEARILAEEFEVDIAIVLRDGEKAYALAQHLRKTSGGDAWPELSTSERAHAHRLGALARRGRLVPFMGAGVSVSAGAPTWAQLIEQLADRAGLDADVRAALLDEGRDVLDQATFVRQAIGARSPEDPLAFVRAIAEITNVERYGLAPALLAALESEQAITLNYDTLFEKAAEDGGLPRRTIPSAAPRDADQDRWLLKLHGTVDDPTSIVLTRSDYLGFHTERAALSSIVKATLMTRHVLFVGFGMSDDHFHEIIHDVRRAMESSGAKLRGVGTVLTLRDDPLDRELLSELDFVPFAPAAPEPDFAASARRLEIFLDAVLAFASDSHAYLLDTTYNDALSADERMLRDRILRMVSTLPDDARSTTSWSVVAAMLSDLGLEETPAQGSTRGR
ncbi:SIR2 family protein [uncultured Microbacterium sp.]|uniref:SIR2 family protein n=1 Tax=uncultured Microbacterium sp. TaxID=191216 RepID=UPI002608F0B4|nr:SIR2 family protein [uncultured Microbacterium sp.]